MVKGEAASPLIGLPAEFSTFKPFANHFVQIDTGALLGHQHVCLSWLIQSQSQAGTASAITANEDPKAYGLRLALQPAPNLGCSRLRYLNHRSPLQRNEVSYLYPVPYGTTETGSMSRELLNGNYASPDTLEESLCQKR